MLSAVRSFKWQKPVHAYRKKTYDYNNIIYNALAELCDFALYKCT